MLGFVKIFLLVICHFVFVQCLIPSLTVRRLNTKLIHRKRLDNLEMCRIFNAENERLTARQYVNSFRPPQHSHMRFKRSLDPLDRPKSDEDTIPEPPKLPGAAPMLKEEDAQRVEDIVDKLYDDLTEEGEPVTYRHRNAQSQATTVKADYEKGAPLRSGRRFDFAPAFLLGPDGQKSQNKPPESVPGPDWVKKWRHGIVPFFIDPKTYDSHLADKIMSSFDYFEKATCIRLQRLREKPVDQQSMRDVEWVYVTNPTGIRQCVHSNERLPNRGVQMVVLGYNCLSLGEVVHEVMHILGFSHEHTRSDRGQHVSVFWDNIKPGYKKYFEIRPDDALARLPYDYASVLHYPPRAFSKNGKVTLLAKSDTKLGQRSGLSDIDVEKINIIFGNECVDRNKDYLLTTCPTVVKRNDRSQKATQEEITNYFKDRLWQHALITYKLRDAMEFSTEEKENINAVIRHIEQETCIEFLDVTAGSDEDTAPSTTEPNNTDPSSTDPSSTAPSSTDPSTTDPSNTEPSTTDPSTTDPSTTDPSNKDTIDNNQTDMPPNNSVNDNQGDKNNTASNENTNSIVDDHDGFNTDANNNNVGQIISMELNEDKPQQKSHERVDNAEKPIARKSSKKLQTRDKILKVKPKANPKTRVKRYISGKSRIKPKRRHAKGILVLTRSTKPGCRCPKPGKPEGETVLEINADCFNSVNDLLHVFVHMLGLDHQHNMHDRDDFLHIVWDQLTPELKEEMKDKLPPAAAVGFPYDYQSVMHYPWLQIKNGVTNIMYPIWNDGWAMGHWQGLSSTDVQKINLLYYDQCLLKKKLASKFDL